VASLPPADDYSRLPESELQRRYHEHDLLALNELYKRYQTKFQKQACLWSGYNPDVAEESLGKFRLRLALPNVQDSYDPGREWQPWASTILRNIVVDHLRRLGRDRSRPEPAGGLDQFPAPEYESEKEFAEREKRKRSLLAALSDCLARLKVARVKGRPLKYFEALDDQYREGLSEKESADRHGVSTKDIENWRWRGRKWLGGCLKKKGFEGGCL
jgi:RNA polymerase sigma factor (sigma-70 family)